VREAHVRAGREVRGRAGLLDERGESGDVVGLDVRLKDGGDGAADARCLLEVPLDERLVRVDGGEQPVCGAAEQVARARGDVDEEGSEIHRRSRSFSLKTSSLPMLDFEGRRHHARLGTIRYRNGR
jgi:hypothetical protein